MVYSPVESSGIQFCVSIWLAVQWSPVESSFVLSMAGSPVESSGVHVDCVGGGKVLWKLAKFLPLETFIS